MRLFQALRTRCLAKARTRRKERTKPAAPHTVAAQAKADSQLRDSVPREEEGGWVGG